MAAGEFVIVFLINSCLLYECYACISACPASAALLAGRAYLVLTDEFRTFITATHFTT